MRLQYDYFKYAKRLIAFVRCCHQIRSSIRGSLPVIGQSIHTLAAILRIPDVSRVAHIRGESANSVTGIADSVAMG